MNNIVIVGLGIIGGSFAKAIRRAYPNTIIGAIDLDHKTLDTALSQQVIDIGETHNQTLLQDADLIILALYPGQIKEYILNHSDLFKDGVIITEATGVKTGIMEMVLPILPDNVEFIFGHPMAGRESQGYAYSDDHVFDGANYIVTPHAANDISKVDAFIAFIKELGFGKVTVTSPEEHDAMIAYTSQLTHLIAAALINSDPQPDKTAAFIGDSFRELTRIAKMNHTLWSELMLTNKEALIASIEAFEDQLNLLKQGLLDTNKPLLERAFQESTHRRTNLVRQDITLSSQQRK